MSENIFSITSFLFGGCLSSFLISILFYKLGFKKEIEKLNRNLRKKNIENIFETFDDLTFFTERCNPDKTYTASEVKDIQLKVIEKTKEQIKTAIVARIEYGEFDADN